MSKKKEEKERGGGVEWAGMHTEVFVFKILKALQLTFKIFIYVTAVCTIHLKLSLLPGIVNIHHI